MPRKKFEEERYSSVKAVLMRDAAAVGRGVPRGERGEAAEAPLAQEATELQVAPEPAKSSEKAPVRTRSQEPAKPAQETKVVRMPDRPAAGTGSRGKLTDGKMKRFRLAVEEDQQVEDALASIKRRTRQSITLSHVARVACELLVRLEEDVVEELERNPLPAQPSTQDSVAYATYEEEVLKRLRRVYKRSR